MHLSSTRSYRLHVANLHAEYWDVGAELAIDTL